MGRRTPAIIPELSACGCSDPFTITTAAAKEQIITVRIIRPAGSVKKTKSSANEATGVEPDIFPTGWRPNPPTPKELRKNKPIPIKNFRKLFPKNEKDPVTAEREIPKKGPINGRIAKVSTKRALE